MVDPRPNLGRRKLFQVIYIVSVVSCHHSVGYTNKHGQKRQRAEEPHTSYITDGATSATSSKTLGTEVQGERLLARNTSFSSL